MNGDLIASPGGDWSSSEIAAAMDRVERQRRQMQQMQVEDQQRQQASAQQLAYQRGIAAEQSQQQMTQGLSGISQFLGGGGQTGGATAAGGTTAGGTTAAGGTAAGGAAAGGTAAGGGGAAASGGAGGMSAGGGLAAAGPWAALAALIIGNETYAKKKGYRSEDSGQYTKDLLNGKVAVQDVEQRWSPMLFGKDDKTGMGAEMNAAPKFAMLDVKGGLKDLKKGPIGKLLGLD